MKVSGTREVKIEVDEYELDRITKEHIAKKLSVPLKSVICKIDKKLILKADNGKDYKKSMGELALVAYDEWFSIGARGDDIEIVRLATDLDIAAVKVLENL